MEFIDTYGELIGLAGLLFFFIFFVGVLAWVFRPGTKKMYREMSQIPLKEDN